MRRRRTPAQNLDRVYRLARRELSFIDEREHRELLARLARELAPWHLDDDDVARWCHCPARVARTLVAAAAFRRYGEASSARRMVAYARRTRLIHEEHEAAAELSRCERYVPPTGDDA